MAWSCDSRCTKGTTSTSFTKMFFCPSLMTWPSFNLDLVVLIKVVQVMLEALCLFLPRRISLLDRLPILHNHCRCRWHQDFLINASIADWCHNLKICPKTNWVLNKLHATSKPLADCSSSSSGKNGALRIGSHGWPLQIYGSPARDARRETANAKASLCKGLTAWLWLGGHEPKRTTWHWE